MSLLHDSFGIKFLDDIIDWIGKNLDPEDVFREKLLKEWAESNGYIERG